MLAEKDLSPNQKRVKLFIGLVVRILTSHYTFHTLQSAETDAGLLTASAPQFFSFLNEVLIRDFYLEVAKITDKSRSCGRDNLTISSIICELEWTQEQQTILQKYQDKLEGFRPHLLEARNRIIAHNDLSTYENDGIENVGGFDEGLDVEFVETLESFCNYIHKEAFGEIWGKFIPSCPGDADDLIDDLCKARAYDQVFENPTTSIEMLDTLLNYRTASRRGKS